MSWAAFCTRTDSDGNLNVFNVEHNGDERWLNANNGNPDNEWNPEDVWVFSRSNPHSFLLQVSLRGVLFNQLSMPPAQHTSNLF